MGTGFLIGNTTSAVNLKMKAGTLYDPRLVEILLELSTIEFSQCCMVSIPSLYISKMPSIDGSERMP